MLGLWKRISRIVATVEDGITVFFLITATSVLFINVVLRYFFQSGLGWAEEFIIFSMIWVTFIGGSICVRKNTHVAMRLIVDMVKNATVRRKYEMTLNGVATAFCIVGVMWGQQHVLFLVKTGQTSPAIRLPMFIPYLAIPVGFALMSLRFLEQLRASGSKGNGEGGEERC